MNNPLVQPDPGLYIWTIVTFLVLVGLLARFAWRPLLDALDRRQESIRRALDEARQARQELERLRDESSKLLVEARKEADAIISNTRADAARAGEDLKRKSRADAENIIRNAERQIELEAARAVEQIRREAVDLSIAIASKIVQRTLTKEDNERLIGETLKEIESRGVN
jgi:F-type H+-transporting ATPase subunit b